MAKEGFGEKGFSSKGRYMCNADITPNLGDMRSTADIPELGEIIDENREMSHTEALGIKMI